MLLTRGEQHSSMVARRARDLITLQRFGRKRNSSRALGRAICAMRSSSALAWLCREQRFDSPVFCYVERAADGQFGVK